MPVLSHHLRVGFTLVEVLVSIAILAVVASLLLPAIAVVRRSADTVVCASNLRQIGMGLFAYSDDENGYFPAHDNQSVSSWPYAFGDWGTGQWGGRSNFYQAYLPVGRKLFYCPTGLRWQRSFHGVIRESYRTFPRRPPTNWMLEINYAYFAGPNEKGGNSRGGPITAAQATNRSTLIGDVMRFGTSSPYTNVGLWNHLGRAYVPGGNTLTDASGGHLLYGDGHVGWIGGVENLLANRRKMKGNDSKSYCASQ